MIKFTTKNAFGLLTLFISAVVLIMAIKFNGGFTDFFGQLKSATLIWIMAAFGAVFVYWLIDGIVLNALIRTKYKKFSFFRAQLTTMTGFLYCNLTPFATGGQPAQIYQLSKLGVGVGDSCSFITVKSIIYQVMLTLASIFALILIGSFFMTKISYVGILFIIGFLCNNIFIGTILLICFKVRFTKRVCFSVIKILDKIKFGNKKLIKNKKTTLKNCLKHIKTFYDSFSVIKKSPRLLLVCCGITLIQLVAFYSIPYFVFKAFNAPQPEGVSTVFLYMICLNSMQNMITQFVPIPGAAGAAEGSLSLFLNVLYPKPLVFTGVVIWRFITYYFTIIVGSLTGFLNLRVSDKGKRFLRNLEE